VIDLTDAHRLISDNAARLLYLAVFNSALDVCVVMRWAEVDAVQLATLHVFMGNASFLLAYITRNLGHPHDAPPDGSQLGDPHQD